MWNPENPSAPGSYKLVFQADPDLGFISQFSLENVVFDDIAPGDPSLSLPQIMANGNTINTAINVYPATLNSIDTTGKGNTYTSTTSTSSESLAYPCPSRLPCPNLCVMEKTHIRRPHCIFPQERQRQASQGQNNFKARSFRTTTWWIWMRRGRW